MKINAYWCNIPNFGDALNVRLFKQLANIDLNQVDTEHAEIIGIGSLLENLLIDTNYQHLPHITQPINIFTTGFGFDTGGFFHNPNIKFPESFKRDIKCWAVRGKLTAGRIEKICGITKQCITIGDGGLLSALLIDKTKIKTVFDLGIVPHYADKDHPVFKQILDAIPNSVILDPTINVEKFLEQLCQCQAVISTAMHPLIACDSLHIPNRWVRISEHTTSRYKFHDYYSAFNTDQEPVDLQNGFSQDILKQIITEKLIPDDVIEQKKLELLTVFNNMISELRHKHSLWQRTKKFIMGT